MISVTCTAVKIGGRFTYQLSPATSPKTTGKNVASLSCRRWIQFITITAINGRKKSSSMKSGNGRPTKPRTRLPGISRK